MVAALISSIGDLKRLCQSYQPSEIIIPNFRLLWGAPSESQIQAWDTSLLALVESLQNPAFDKIPVIIELQMPVGAERADCVLLGGTKDSPKALIIELKQWMNMDLDIVTGDVNVPGQGFHIHPSLQVLNYRGKLLFYNAVAKKYEIYCCSFLHNASEEDRSRISRGIASDWVAKAPIFVKPEEIAEYIADKLLPATLLKDDAVEFANAPFKQSQYLFDFIRNYSDAISRDMEVTLAETGMGLTDEQRKIKNLVKNFLHQPDFRGTDIIVNGRPGSGKTLLAVSILLMAFEQQRECLLALRNNRLQAVLKHIFNSISPGLSGFMLYFEPRIGIGLENFQGRVNVLVCDEAQRIRRETIEKALPKSDISVIFLDESQRLNPPEQGTVENFVNISKSLGRTPIVGELTGLIRCTGGQHYAAWVESFLAHPSDIDALGKQAQLWRSVYQLRFSSSIEDLLFELRQKREEGNKVALVASFTESPGYIGNPNHQDNLRIGFPLTSGFDLYREKDVRIPWLMRPTDYKRFWVDGECNELDRVASIYGCQGFETDYVGVIWGRDLLYRNGRWVLGNPNYCYDTIDQLVTGKIPNRRWSYDALPLVLNRYRIFLTRGIKGCIIFCEDEETRRHFVNLGKRIDNISNV
ncbi:MAG: DNA/RNA helicase domain-containing protein [Candidatus Methanomethyliaceae archaeon]